MSGPVTVIPCAFQAWRIEAGDKAFATTANLAAQYVEK